MSAKFSPNGSHIFALGRRMNPVLYDISSPKAIAEFDHPGYFNSCTMKSGTFGTQDLVFSGKNMYNYFNIHVYLSLRHKLPSKNG